METAIAQIGKAFQPKDIISEAIYMNYRFNRMNNNTITPQQWTRVFGDTMQMEERYQVEIFEQRYNEEMERMENSELPL